jgi:hypothetical protein
MRLFSFKNLALATAVGFMTLVGVDTLNAQSRGDYRDLQQAQREVERQRQQYMRTRSQRDYREWQRAQRELQEERQEFRQERREDIRDNRRNVARNYRIYRDGRYYSVDERGANLLRQAVNSGYQQGYRQGQVDRRYGRGGNYYGNNVYRSATFGYQSYVDRSQYQYYFQQGFQRGYEDGYNSQMRYGYRSGNNYNILGNILGTILNMVDN